jgi:hypothetical protein
MAAANRGSGLAYLTEVIVQDSACTGFPRCVDRNAVICFHLYSFEACSAYRPAAAGAARRNLEPRSNGALRRGHGIEPISRASGGTIKARLTVVKRLLTRSQKGKEEPARPVPAFARRRFDGTRDRYESRSIAIRRS